MAPVTDVHFIAVDKSWAGRHKIVRGVDLHYRPSVTSLPIRGRLTDRRTDRPTSRDTQSDRQTDRQIDRQTDRLTDRQTDRQRYLDEQAETFKLRSHICFTLVQLVRIN